MERITVSILGSGWLGLPLAEALVAAGYRVRASSTTPARLAAIAAAGATPHRLALTRDGLDGDGAPAFLDADCLVVTIPPSGAEDYAASLGGLASASRAAGVGRLIFTSSTSVYPDLNRVVTEIDAGAPAGPPLRRNGAAVLAAEARLADEGPAATVLRLAGLYGYGRHPARHLAGRTGIPAGDAPVNLVHRDDVIAAILAVMESDLSGAFNVVAPEHPSRRATYRAEAERLGLDPPAFEPGLGAWKEVSGASLATAIGFTYRHPDPLAAAP